MEATLTGPNGRVDLTSSVLTIGRAPDNRLALQDQQASSHHAEIRPDSQGYLLVDMNSRNGTYVNEQRLAPQTPRLLTSGDVVRIGETRLVYATGGEDDATVRANSADYANPGYSPTVAVPPSSMPGYNQPSQPAYSGYQQPTPSSPDYQQPQPPSYPNYQQPTPYNNYPQQAEQPGFQQPSQSYPTPSYPQQPQPQGYPQQAPWAAAPGQFGAPPAAPAAAPPKKRRTGLVIGIIVLLLLIVGGGSLYFFVLRSTPEKTLSAVCTAYTNGDAQGLFNQLSARAQSQTSVAKISQSFQLAKSPPVNGIKTCNFSNVQQSGSTASADLTFTFGNAQINSLIKPVKFQLVDENGTWKLDSAAQPTPSQ